MGKKFGLTNRPVTIGSEDKKLSVLPEEVKEKLMAAIENKQAANKDAVVDISEYIPGQYVQKQVPLDILEAAPDTWNFFSKPSKEKIIALAESIYYNGLLQPIVAREIDPRGNILQILAGHTRVEAYRVLRDTFHAAEYETITALVFPFNVLDDKKAEDIVCDTNFMQRGTLSVSETAKCISLKAKRIKESGLKYGEGSVASRIAAYYHIKRSSVFRWQRIANLIPEMVDLSEKRQLSAASMYKLAAFSPKEQERIFKRAADYISNNSLRPVKTKHKVEDVIRIIKNDTVPDVSIHFSVSAELLNGRRPILILADKQEYQDVLKKLKLNKKLILI